MRLYIILTTFVLLIVGSLFLMRRATIYRPPENTNSAQTVSLPTITEPRVTFIDPHRGNRDARVTIVMFSDYYCPFCAELESTMNDLLSLYPNDVRIVWKDFPNESIHPNSKVAAEAARCAGEEGKFWQYHDLLFQKISNNELFSFNDLAASLSLDSKNFSQCLDSQNMEPTVTTSFLEGRALGVDGTPYFFINGKKFDGTTLEEFSAAIEKILAKDQ